jgi:hypothetical protein
MSDRAEMFPALLNKDAKSDADFTKAAKEAAMSMARAESKNLFGAFTKTFEPTVDDIKNPDKIKPDEGHEVRATTFEILNDFVAPLFKDAVKNSVAKELTNRDAVGQVTVLGIELGAIPATALLKIEKQLKLTKSIIEQIPVHDDSKQWDLFDKSRKIWKKEPADWSWASEKEDFPLELSPATDRHPAQVAVRNRDIHVGKYTKETYTGNIPKETKAQMLTNVNAAISDVISARDHINMVETTRNDDVGEKLFKSIFGVLLECEE